MVGQDYKYWAFISYSHADEAWAQRLRVGLERYRIPRRLVGQSTPVGPVPARLYPVFRDRDELPGSSALGPELQKALAGSRTQIVICSPQAVQSRWVNEEIKYYKSLGRADRVFALIVDGEPHAQDPARECFPQALRHAVDDEGRVLVGQQLEPIAADARPHADGPDNAQLKLIAGILGVGFDDLKQRELHARNQRLAVLSGVATSVASVTMVLAVLAWDARNDAQRRRQQAEGLIEFMLGDLREKLEPIGKLDVLDAVGNKAMAYFATLDESDRTDAALLSRATALRQIGHVRLKQGQFAGAAEAFNEALKLNGELAARRPTDAMLLFNVGETQFAQGNASYLKGDYEDAMRWFELYRQTADRLVVLDPANRRWQQVVVEAGTNIGVMRYQNNELDRAVEALGDASERQKTLLAADPRNPEYLNNLSMVHGWLSLIARKQQRWQASLDEALHQAALIRRLLADAPEDARYREQLVHALHHVVNGQRRQGILRPGSAELQEAVALSTELRARDAQNIEYARAHSLSLFYQSEAHLAAGEWMRATAAGDEALTLSRRLYRQAPEKLVLVDDLLSRLGQAAWLAHLQQDDRGAQARIDEALALPLTPRQIAESAPENWLRIRLLGWRIATTDDQRMQQARATEDLVARPQAEPAPEWMLGYWVLKGKPAQAAKSYGKLSAAERQHPLFRSWCETPGQCGI